ncbi:MAG: diguanylate cyclase [Spirochaetes bacterium]|nr:diguanylate cyclase [Spirochaetota bacterium]
MNIEADKTIFDKLKNVVTQKLVAPIPVELKDQFSLLQLQNSIYRIRILTIVMFIVRLVNIFFYDTIPGHFQHRELYIFGLYIESIGIVAFNLLAYFFLKRDQRTVLWAMCYLFIAFSLVLYSIGMISAGTSLHILVMFFISSYSVTVIPDFKPKAFISFSVLYFIVTVYIFFLNSQIYNVYITSFLSAIFAVTLITKIIFYNHHVHTFVYIFNIKELNKKLESLSITDELTKLNNRRSFLNYMNITWKQCQRLNLSLSVIMIDVDFFKKYNDSMGHLEGDNVLIAISQCMRNQLKRETDFIARFGGEEFVCLISYADKESAEKLARKLVRSIESLEIPHPMSDISKYVTISAGMAHIVPSVRVSQTQLLDEADKALYKAKQSGRNKVEISNFALE